MPVSTNLENEILTIVEDLVNQGEDEFETVASRELAQQVKLAFSWLSGKCHRRFIRKRLTSVYDAPPDDTRLLGTPEGIDGEIVTNDLGAEGIAAEEIVTYSNLVPLITVPPALTWGLDYVRLRNRFGTAYDRIMRIDTDGKAVRWDDEGRLHDPPWQPFGSISITADHGWVSVPDEIRQAAVITSVRLAMNADILYQRTGGAPGLGDLDGVLLWDMLLRQLCWRFIRYVPEQRGVPVE